MHDPRTTAGLALKVGDSRPIKYRSRNRHPARKSKLAHYHDALDATVAAAYG